MKTTPALKINAAKKESFNLNRGLSYYYYYYIELNYSIWTPNARCGYFSVVVFNRKQSTAAKQANQTATSTYIALLDEIFKST